MPVTRFEADGMLKTNILDVLVTYLLISIHTVFDR